MALCISKVLHHFSQICAYGAGRGSFLGPVYIEAFLSFTYFIIRLISICELRHLSVVKAAVSQIFTEL